MQTTSFLLAFAALLQVSLAFPVSVPALSKIFQRQSQTDTTCETYSSVANYTAISSNATMRAAFIQNSPAGTDATTSILDTVTPLLPAMTADTELNTRCGNLTTVAIAGAASNFSMGIVSGFTIATPPSGFLGWLN